MSDYQAYQFSVSNNAAKDFKKYLKSGDPGFKQALKKLRENPKRAGQPLAGDLKGYYKIRKDPFRLVYKLNEQTRTIEVVAIQTRDDVYVEIETDSTD